MARYTWFWQKPRLVVIGGTWGTTSVIPAVVISAMHHAGRIRVILYCAERTNTKEYLPRTYYCTTTVRRRGCISIIFVNVLGLSWLLIWRSTGFGRVYPGFHLEIRHNNLNTKSALLWPHNLYLSGIEESARTLLWCWMLTGRKSQDTQHLTCLVQQCFLVEIHHNSNWICISHVLYRKSFS